MSKKETTIEDLARMVAAGFNNMQESMDKQFGEVRQEIANFREENERGHLDLKLRQDNVAYRFEMQNLDKRVTRLEKKAKFT